MENTIPQEGDLLIWWVPQMPMKAFEVPVRNLREAALLLDTLGAYDAFQFENGVKPDYCNTGGLQVFEDGDWFDWTDPETGDDFDLWRRNPDWEAAALPTPTKDQSHG